MVADRLRRFFAVLREQVAQGTDDLWRRVQTRFVADPTHARGDPGNASALPSPASPPRPDTPTKGE